ncbi:MAG: efflux RND transporter permease subunit, partial [Rubrivivax sp.]
AGSGDGEPLDQPDDRSWTERHAPRLAALFERAKDGFNRGFARTSENYERAAAAIIDRRLIFVVLYLLICGLLAFLFLRMPTGFLPTEDQGNAIVSFQLPPGATINRAEQVQKQVETYFRDYESDNVTTLFTVAGGGGGAAGQNVGRGYLNFKDWSERKGHDNSADAITGRAAKAFSGLRDAEVFALVPPPIRGLGQSNGFTIQLQNTGDMTREQFSQAKDKLLEAARSDASLAAVRVSELPDKATLKIDLDPQKLATLGLTQANVNRTLSTAWGGSYVNDFIDRGRVKRVYVQGDAPYRSKPEDLFDWYVRGSDGSMTPFSAFASTSWAQAPVALSRFNGIPSFEFNGQPAVDKSSGEAIARIEALARDIPGTRIAYAGLTFQERLSAGQAPILYGLSLLVVFLCLAALYESWSVPVAVLLIVPLGLVGAVLAVTLRGLINDVYLQLGLLTTMGLASKNAILMIEFAEQAEKQGKSPIDAALEAARIRLRPILMTSLAFVFGVMPLALSTGAGANSRIAIGTAVVGGMLTATILAIFYIPLFFVLVRQATGWRRKKKPTRSAGREQAA